MKKILFLISLLWLCSCGSLKLSPLGCKSPGYWGTFPVNPGDVETKYSQEYYVMMVDKEVKLRDFLSEKGVACDDVKKIRVQMSSVFFVKRVIDIYVTR